MDYMKLGFSAVSAAESTHRECSLRLSSENDESVLALVFVDVVQESEIESLRMFGSHYYPVSYFRFWKAGKHCGEVDDELAVRVCDDCEI